MPRNQLQGKLMTPPCYQICHYTLVASYLWPILQLLPIFGGKVTRAKSQSSCFSKLYINRYLKCSRSKLTVLSCPPLHNSVSSKAQKKVSCHWWVHTCTGHLGPGQCRALLGWGRCLAPVKAFANLHLDLHICVYQGCAVQSICQQGGAWIKICGAWWDGLNVKICRAGRGVAERGKKTYKLLLKIWWISGLHTSVFVMDYGVLIKEHTFKEVLKRTQCIHVQISA